MSQQHAFLFLIFFFVINTTAFEIYTLSLHDALPIYGVESACATWRSPFETVVGNGFNLSANPNNEGWVTVGGIAADQDYIDRKSTRLNSSHGYNSYAVFCLKKKIVGWLLLQSALN